MTATALWATYDYKGHRVIVTQQWKDPFGHPMVRIQPEHGDHDQGAGMQEATFLEHARLCAGKPDAPP